MPAAATFTFAFSPSDLLMVAIADFHHHVTLAYHGIHVTAAATLRVAVIFDAITCLLLLVDALRHFFDDTCFAADCRC